MKYGVLWKYHRKETKGRKPALKIHSPTLEDARGRKDELSLDFMPSRLMHTQSSCILNSNAKMYTKEFEVRSGYYVSRFLVS